MKVKGRSSSNLRRTAWLLQTGEDPAVDVPGQDFARGEGSRIPRFVKPQLDRDPALRQNVVQMRE